MDFTNGNAGSTLPTQDFDRILVLDFGSQYSHIIVRKLRDLNIYSEMLACTARCSEIGKPKGIILSGGPASVYDPDAPHVDPGIFDLGIPILGICYGLQELAWNQEKSAVLAGEKREYGFAKLSIIRQHAKASSRVDELFRDLGDEMDTWMSHADKLSFLPSSWSAIATTANAPFACIAHDSKPWFGIQFHPEVSHTPRGKDLLRNFAVLICGAVQNWTMEEFVGKEIKRIRELVGPKGHVLGAVSGGVDSTVAATLMNRAIGDRFHAVLVDNGLLRQDEAKLVHSMLTEQLKINLAVVDATERFLTNLKGVTDPETKRKIIGKNFIDVFQEKAKEIAQAAAESETAGDVEWLLQGTLYPDVIESISYKGPSATIKSHHNVGGLPKDMHLKLIEPLRELFKDEVRVMGLQIGIPEELVWRQPFPGVGLAVRILGEVTEPQLILARKADKIFIDELMATGDLYYKVSQAYAALIPTRAVGVMGDQRVYGQMIALRAVETTDFMTATRSNFDIEHRGFLDRVSNRICNEIEGITRVLYDITSKPPGTIEME